MFKVPQITVPILVVALLTMCVPYHADAKFVSTSSLATPNEFDLKETKLNDQSDFVVSNLKGIDKKSRQFAENSATDSSKSKKFSITQLLSEPLGNSANDAEFIISFAMQADSEIPIEQPLSLWQEIRDGFQLENYDSEEVRRFEKNFASKPHFFRRLVSRASIYLPYVLEQVQRRGMPTEIVLLPIIESSYNPAAHSPSGAAGIWQIMPSTGKRFGLTRDYWYEGRRDVIESTEAALDYLEDQYKTFGEWGLALIAYNAGENRIKRALRRSSNRSKTKGFDLRNLPLETLQYLPKLIALKNIFSDPKKFDIVLPDLTTDPRFVMMQFQFQVDLNQVALVTETGINEFSQLNPGLRRGTTHPDGPHSILVPADTYAQLREWNSELTPQKAMGAGSIGAGTRYFVQAGDTLSSLAMRYGTTIESIMSFNRMKTNRIIVGKTINLPIHNTSSASTYENNRSVKPKIYTVKEGDSLSVIALRYKVSVRNLRRMNQLTSDLILIGQKLHLPTPQATEQRQQTAISSAVRQLHRVKSGESLWTIAKRYNVDIDQLMKWNKIHDQSLIYPMQNLVVYMQ